MSTYFASDVHLRPDRPDRGRRFARFLAGLSPADSLYLVGDLCDFWFASRRRPGDEAACPGLTALAGHIRRGGSAVILTGNHDLWLGSFYAERLGATVIAEPTLDLIVEGLRIRLAHGHLLGARSAWKGLMEGRTFLTAFRGVPTPVAIQLEGLLDRTNDRTRDASDERHLRAYRHYADELAGATDLVVLGHLHRTHDDPSRHPRLIVLGDWKHQASYLRVDATGAAFVTVPDGNAPP